MAKPSVFRANHWGVRPRAVVGVLSIVFVGALPVWQLIHE